ncbi:hypothetical protein [Janthinobacterium sp. 61]|uniref:hypothetical protein n=1 Tax=Janthinobacterium sp. 61 TaxID=2035209 RepID=UPI0011799A98|nr:hypothetical protein [Janthinobacterium sp. 61]
MVAGIVAGRINQAGVSIVSASAALGGGRGGAHFYFRKKTTPVYNFEKNYQLYSSRLAPQGREGAMIICRK